MTGETLLPHDSDGILAAQVFEHKQFVGCGYLDAGDQDTYSEFNGNSRFIVCKGEDGRVVASLRIIHSDNRGLGSFKTVADMPHVAHRLMHIDPTKIVEIATVVRDKKRSNRLDVSVALYADAWLEFGLEQGIQYWLASIDNEVLAYFRGTLGFEFTDLGSSVDDYMGSPTTPVLMDIKSASESLKNSNPKLARAILG